MKSLIFRASGGDRACHFNAIQRLQKRRKQHWAWEAKYATVKPHFEHMLEAIEEGLMPKMGSTQLTDEEKDQLECWKNSGYPE